MSREKSLFGREIYVPFKQFAHDLKSKEKMSGIQKENLNDLNKDLNEYSPSKKSTQNSAIDPILNGKNMLNFGTKNEKMLNNKV